MKHLTIGVEVAPQHAFGRNFVEGVSAFAAEHRGWRLMALNQSNLTDEVFAQCRGVIVRIFNQRVLRLAQTHHTQLVDIYCAKALPGIGQVIPDDAAASSLAAEFFHHRGFQHFAYCGMNAVAYSDTCLQAFKKSVEDFGYQVSVYSVPSKLHGRIPFDHGTPYVVPDAPQLRKWLRSLPKPVALLCCNDHRAYQVLSTALKDGIDIPKEISLLGSDNDTTLCSFSSIPLSSIDPDAHKVGYTAARMLAKMIESQPDMRLHPIVKIAPKGIVERASTETVPFSPAWLAESILKIERELEHGITASDIFTLSGHSVPHVEKVFRDKLGISVQDYIVRTRMKRATELLLRTQKSTKEVAAACGYASPQYFCRVFKNQFGVSPGRYHRK